MWLFYSFTAKIKNVSFGTTFTFNIRLAFKKAYRSNIMNQKYL